METKKILGLDIGTNSIGAALINMPKTIEDFGNGGNIEWLGSRIIPVDGEYLKKFESGGQAETKASARRQKRGSRRLKHRYKLRRTRLVQVLKLLGWIDESFPLDNPQKIKQSITEKGIFSFRISDSVPVSDITYREFYKAFGHTDEQIKKVLEEISYRKQNKGKHRFDDIDLLPEDWVVYFIRKKALTKEITLPELIRVFYVLNQRRGFKSGRKDLKTSSILSYDDFYELKRKIDNGEYIAYKKGEGEEKKTQYVSTTTISSITQLNEEKDSKGNFTYQVEVTDKRVLPWKIKRREKPGWEGKEVKLLVEQKINRKGEIKQDSDPKLPKPDNWSLTMIALDNQIDESGKQVGEFFFDKLTEFAQKGEVYKIRQNVVRREKYQKEIKAIWEKQLEIRKAEGREEELLNRSKLNEIAQMLYKHNEAKQKELKEKGLFHIICNDIIYYQRDLKSQKNSISECRFEKRIGIEKNERGEWIQTGSYGLKCCPVSSPYFQEFRMWQDIHNIRILQKESRANDKIKVDVDVTKNFLNELNKDQLFDLFGTTAEITQHKIFEKLNEINSGAGLNEEEYRINLFVNRNKLKGNETKEFFRKIFRKNKWDDGEKVLSDTEQLFKLWHILYSISGTDLEKSKKGIRTALNKNFPHIPENIVDDLCNQEEFEKSYAAYSSSAIKKLLTLMRCGKYWSRKAIEETELRLSPSPNSEKIRLSDRIEIILKTGWDKEYKVDKRTGELIKERKFESFEQFSGLPTWMAGYMVYGRHSERENTDKYSLEEIRKMNVPVIPGLHKLKGNPLVKQVVMETVQLVKDLCLQYGQPYEIHIELSRDLKKNSEQRKTITDQNDKNLQEKLRVKKLLHELLNEPFDHYDDEGNEINQPFSIKPNPGSPIDIEKFRIYKNCASFDWNDKEKKNEDEIEMEKLFKDGKKERIPTKAEIKKYILWLSQKCRSPYTGMIIPLSKLFDETQYEVEHIIPRSLLKYDAIENLVICETGVNKAKGQRLAATFIKSANGSCTHGVTTYTLLKFDDYQKHCKETFHGKKYKNLVTEEIPEDFIARQINDTRYIGKKLGELLFPFAKNEAGLIFTIGSITSELKKNWGLNKIWKRLVEPRFRRLEELTGKNYVFPNQHDPGDIDFDVPEINDFDSKRIDHRHHALDALITAATTREHIRYFNTLSAADTNEEKRKYQYTLCKGKIRDFKLPWETFTKESKEKLQETLVTFKSNQKIISKPYNKYFKWLKNDQGKWEKKQAEQLPNHRWMAVRKSLFNENPLGLIWKKEVRYVKVKDAFRIQIERKLIEHDSVKRKTAAYIYDQIARPVLENIITKTSEETGIELSKTEELLAAIDKHYLKKNKNGNEFILDGMAFKTIAVAEFVLYKAKRVSVDKSFTADKINKIPYAEKMPLANKLRTHLQQYGKPAEAFEGEGMEKLTVLNNKKPIRTITVTDGKIGKDHLDNLFGRKYYEPAAGSIAYFVIYENETTKNREETFSIATHVAIKRIKEGKPIAEKKEGFRLIILQPNDLVYVPTDEEWNKIKAGEQDVINWKNKMAITERIYKMVSADDAFFVQHHIAKAIIPTILSGDGKTKGEIDWHNKSTKMLDGKTNVAERCIKLQVDRLGNIKPAN